MKLTGVISLLSLLNIRSTLSLPSNTSSQFEPTHPKDSRRSNSDGNQASTSKMEAMIEEGTASQWRLIDQSAENANQCKHEDPLECLYDSSLTQFRNLHGKDVTCSISYAWEPEGVEAVSDVTKQTHQLLHLSVLNRNFVGRERELAQLGQLLASGKVGTIAGLGGIGKTRLARAYAHNNPSYELVWWINAETTLDEDYRKLARNLGIAINQEIRLIQKEVKTWLAKKESSLLIFDNVEDYGQVRPYIPELEGTHHVILTSRNQQVPTDWAKPLVLEALTEEEALILIYKMTWATDKSAHQSYRDWEEMLRQGLTGYDDLKAEALGLGRDLGYLPLAIVQACSFIGGDGSISQYRKIFRETKEVLFDSYEKPSDYHLSNQEITLRTTWEIAITKLEETMPLVREIVSYSAFMGSDAIPEAVISAGLKTHSGSRRFDNFTFTKALKALHGQSLLTQGEGQFYVHRLVQAVGRMTLSEDKQKDIITSLLQALNELVDFDSHNPESWETINRLKSHVDSVLGYAKALGIEGKTRGRLLQALGQYLSYVRHAHEEAEAYLVESAAIFREEYGESHTATASAYHAIGRVYKEQDNLSESMRYYQKALGIQKALLGDRHIATASTYHWIGQVYKAQVNLDEAMTYFLKALGIQEELLGDSHTDIADSYHAIAHMYQVQGDLNEAMRCYRKALEITKSLLGDRHTDTASSYHSVGMVYQAQGNLSEAMRYYQKALEINEVLLGDRHPDTAISYNAVGQIYQAQGNLSEAMTYYQRALEIRKELLGERHTETAMTYHDIGMVYYTQGNLSEAMRYYRKVLRINKELLGERHAATAISYHAIGRVYHAQDNLSEAMRYYRKALGVQEAVFGDLHIDTAVTCNDIGQTYLAQGDQVKALRFLRKSYSIFLVLLGPDHRHTITVKNSLNRIPDSSQSWLESWLNYFLNT